MGDKEIGRYTSVQTKTHNYFILENNKKSCINFKKTTYFSKLRVFIKMGIQMVNSDTVCNAIIFPPS